MWKQQLNGEDTVFTLSDDDMLDSLLMLESLKYDVFSIGDEYFACGDYIYSFSEVEYETSK